MVDYNKTWRSGKIYFIFLRQSGSVAGLFLVRGCKDKPEISDISGIYRERKHNSDGPDAPLSRFDVKDQSDDH